MLDASPKSRTRVIQGSGEVRTSKVTPTGDPVYRNVNPQGFLYESEDRHDTHSAAAAITRATRNVPKEEEPGVPVMEELSALGEMTLGKLPLELDDENSVIYDADNKRYFRDGDFYPRDEDYRLFPSYLWRNNIDIASWSSTAYYMAAIKHWRYSTFSMKFRTVWDVMHGHQSIIYYEEANSPIFLFTATHYLQEHKKIDPEASSIFVDTMVFDIDKHTSKGVLANLELKWDLEILMPTVPDTEIVKGSWFCIYKIQDDE